MPLLTPVGVRRNSTNRAASRSRMHTYFRRVTDDGYEYTGGDTHALANTGSTRLINFRSQLHGSPLFDEATASKLFGVQ